MKKQTVMFFPIEVGLAHIARSLAIAEEIHRRGHRVIFALARSKRHIFQKSPVTIVDIGDTIGEDSITIVKSYRDYNLLKKLVPEEIALIKKYDADKVVLDFRLTALVAAASCHKKTYFLTNGHINPYGAKLPRIGMPAWLFFFLEPLSRMFLAQAMRFFLRPAVRLLNELGNPMDLEAWFKTTTYIVPEPPFYFPPLTDKIKLNYVAPLSWEGFSVESPEWLTEIKPDGRTVYLTFGGTGFSISRLVEISRALVAANYRVIVSSGTIGSPDRFPKIKNLFVARFLPGKEVCRRVDAVVCHGGHGTMFEAFHQGKPVLAIPFNPDQMAQATRIQELGLGYCLLKLKPKDFLQVFTFDWRPFNNLNKRIKTKEIVTKVGEIMEKSDRFAAALKKFNRQYPPADGAKQASDIILA